MSSYNYKSTYQCVANYKDREFKLLKKFLMATREEDVQKALRSLGFAYLASSPHLNKAYYQEGRPLSDEAQQTIRKAGLKKLFEKYLKTFILQKGMYEAEMIKYGIRDRYEESVNREVYRHLFATNRKLHDKFPMLDLFLYYNLEETTENADKIIEALERAGMADAPQEE